MGFFLFGKKFEIGRGYNLSHIPLFSSLTPSQIRILEKYVRLAEYKKGDLVYRQGEEGAAFYVIASGRIQLFQKDSFGGEKNLATLYRGEHFGEISLLTEKKHSLSARAKNDALILTVDKDKFQELLRLLPSLSLQFSRTMGMRLSRQESGTHLVSDAKIISFYHEKRGVPSDLFLHNLAASLAKETRHEVILLNLTYGDAEQEPPSVISSQETVPLHEIHFDHYSRWREKLVKNGSGYFSIGLSMREPSGDDASRFVSLMSHLLRDFNFVLVNLPKELDALNLKAMEQSDVVYALTDASSDSLTKTQEMLKTLEGGFKVTKEHIRIITLETVIPDELTIRQVEQLLNHPVSYKIPFDKQLGANVNPAEPLVFLDPDSVYSRAVRYLARELGEVLVGLALGSGAAYGLAHIGVIKVLEAEGIHVDVVAGSSIGAFIGAVWASGVPIGKMEEGARHLKGWNSFFRLLGLRDFSIPPKAFIKGNQIYKYIKGYIGDVTFRDLKKRLLVPTTNLFTSEEVVFREGEVARAVRASLSIPGIFLPVFINNQYLIDGGVSNPLPVHTLREIGVKKIIAVNVIASPEDYREKNAVYTRKKEELEMKLREDWGPRGWFYRFGRVISKKFSTNIFNVLMNTIQFMEYTVAKLQGMDADVVIHPIVLDANWAEFYNPVKFIEVGEARTRELLPEIKKLVEEK